MLDEILLRPWARLAWCSWPRARAPRSPAWAPICWTSPRWRTCSNAPRTCSAATWQRWCATRRPEELNDTRNAQIAIAALSVGMGRSLEARGIEPDALLGFSLGQVSAMVLGGMLAEEDAFALIAERSLLMGEAADANPGVMSALLKITLPEAEALCAQCAEDEVLVPANLNGGGQIVIAGTPGGGDPRRGGVGREQGPLLASGHVRCLPQPAHGAGAGALRRLPGEGGVPRAGGAVIGNVHAAPLDVAGAREELVAHLVSPVQFEASVAKLQAVRARRCSRKVASAACSPIS